MEIAQMQVIFTASGWPFLDNFFYYASGEQQMRQHRPAVETLTNETGGALLIVVGLSVLIGILIAPLSVVSLNYLNLHSRAREQAKVHEIGEQLGKVILRGREVADRLNGICAGGYQLIKDPQHPGTKYICFPTAGSVDGEGVCIMDHELSHPVCLSPENVKLRSSPNPSSATQ
jgi:hypothetical protein